MTTTNTNSETAGQAPARGSRTGRLRRACLAATAAATFTGAALLGAPAYAITGGTDVPEGRYPFVVELQAREAGGDWDFICGASLVDDTTIITAAHCLPGAFPDGQDYEVRVVFDRVDRTGDGGTIVEPSGIDEVLPHPQFNEERNRDLGLITLREPAPPGTERVHLPSPGAQPVTGSLVTAMGWGWDHDHDALSDRLQEIDISVIAPEKCGDPLGSGPAARLAVDERLCAGRTGDEVGGGDSGSPLVQTGGDGSSVQIGLTSGGIPGFPNAFTNLASPTLQDWIEENR